MRRTPSWLIGHKEWAPGRKIDPHPVNMDDARLRVAAQMRALSKHAPKPAGAGDIYVVKKGDTLFHIALTHHESVQELKKANRLSDDLITVGQKLTVTS